jgi:hypothetical protein
MATIYFSKDQYCSQYHFSWIEMVRTGPVTLMTRHMIVLLGCLLFLAACLSRPLLGYPDDNNRPTPHPWLASAPGEYVRLINRGKVEIQVDDSILASYGKAALTRFQVKLDYKVIYRTPRATAIDGERMLLLDIRYTKRDVSVNHVIIIPTTYSPEAPWKDRLLKHEMDHVAITTDPRLQAMVGSIFSRGFTIDVSAKVDNQQRNGDDKVRIDEFTQEIIQEIESLLQYQYDELDQASRDGLVELDDRSAFFQSLYDYEACKKYLPKSLANVSLEMWNKWVKIDTNKLAAHYSLSR